jgi:signal peptidase
MANKGKAIKTIYGIVEKIVIIAIVLISAIILTQRFTNNEKAFLGFRIFRVQTGSMEPKYHVGDVIIVKEKDTDKIKIGEDVTYWGTSGVMKGKLVTHQVINIEEIDGQRVFHTQGIANTSKDPLVYADQINGIVLGKLHLVTKICTLLSNQYVFYFLGILPLTLFVFFSFVKRNSRYEN